MTSISPAMRPSVPADVADLRVSVGVIETKLDQLTATIQEHFVQRRESNERMERDRLVETETLQASIAEVGSKVETMTARIGVVESDLRNIKIGWAVLVKAATVGSVITTTLAGIIAWLAWAIGWIKAH